MSEDENTRGSRRYIALDIHKKYCVIGGVDREGRVVLHAVRVEHADLEGWLKKNLRSTDHVVFESTTNAWHVYDLLSPLVERVVVANPIQVKQIAQARVKTDIRDTFLFSMSGTFEEGCFQPHPARPVWRSYLARHTIHLDTLSTRTVKTPPAAGEFFVRWQ